MNDRLENQTGSEKLFDLPTDLAVKVLGLRFILHLVSTCLDFPEETPGIFKSEALVLEGWIGSRVFVEALVGIVIWNAVQ
jgi:hypothetical protein